MPKGQDTTILFINGLFSTILETDYKAVVKLVTLWARSIQPKCPGNFGPKLHTILETDRKAGGIYGSYKLKPYLSY